MAKIIDHIFFDLDHTLWDFDTNSKITLFELFNDQEIVDLNIDFNKFIVEYRRINSDYWELYRNNEISKSALRVGRFLDTFRMFGHEVSYEFADKFAKKYLNICPYKTNLLPNAIRVLNHLQQKYNLHIITNGFEEVQHIKLNESSLLPFFKTIVCSEDAGVKKPHPKIFEFAMEKANSKPNESIMIGDCLNSDVNGAINVGMQAIYFNPEKKKVHHDYHQIHDLKELITKL